MWNKRIVLCSVLTYVLVVLDAESGGKVDCQPLLYGRRKRSQWCEVVQFQVPGEYSMRSGPRIVDT